MRKPIIVIGSSIAGVSAAEAARRQDSEVDILILTEDLFEPYYRLRICEVLDNPSASSQLALHPGKWYEDRRIKLETGAAVSEVLPARHQVRLADGRSLDYERLVIASGSKSFVPQVKGISRPGVQTLWTMQNALDISQALEKASRVAVIGGGLLGLEAAYHVQRRGLATTVIEKAPRLLANQLDEAGSEILKARVLSLGVEVVTAADVVEITGSAPDPESPAAGVLLSDGREYRADLVLVSIGVQANTGLLEGSGIEVRRRITTDERMQTSSPDIYAAGDVAEPDGYWFGLWSVSRLQGQVAGTNAAGGDAVFDKTIPPYIINTMETRVAVQGDKGLISEPQYELDVLMDPASRNYSKLIYRNGIFSGFMLVGDAPDFARLQKQLGKPGPVGPG